MHADRLIVHATLVTMDPQRRILSDHGIAIRDGRIAAILPTQALLEQYSAPPCSGRLRHHCIPRLYQQPQPPLPDAAEKSRQGSGAHPLAG